MKITTSKLFVLILIALALIGIASAFSVSAPYIENKELKMYPGQSLTLRFILQNGGAESNVLSSTNVVSGEEIVKVADSKNSFVVIPGQMTPVDFIVSIPSDTTLEKVYDVEIAFNLITPDSKGSLGIGGSITQTFKVIVGDESQTPPAPPVTEPPKPSPEEKEEGDNTLLYLLAGLILIIIIIIIIVILRKKKGSKKVKKNF